MKKILGIVLVAVCGVIGCAEQGVSYESKYTINPDGSGKMDFVLTSPRTSTTITMEGKPFEISGGAVLQRCISACGYETWADMGYEIDNQGRLTVKGTAYFKDLSQASNDHVGKDIKIPISWEKSTKLWKMLVDTSPAMDTCEFDVKVNGRSSAAVSDSDLSLTICMMRWQYFWGEAKVKVRGYHSGTLFYVLPGAIAEVDGFKKVENKIVQLQITEAKFKGSFEKFLYNDKLLYYTLRTGKLDAMNDFFARELFGSKEPKVVVSGELKPLFDYKKEVELAKAAMPTMCKRLGLKIPEPQSRPASAPASVPTSMPVSVPTTLPQH